MPNGNRKCIRCKKIKPLNIGNFKKRESYLDFNPDYDRMCRVCRDLEIERECIKTSYSKKKYGERICAYEDCSIIFIPRRDDQIFCGRTCGMLHRRAKSKEGKAERTRKRNSGESIPQKFLERGKIYGVDYR